MTKEEIRLKAVDNAKKYEVWPPVADYQDGLIKGFEDGAEWMLDNPTGGALLYAVGKTAERTKREMIKKAADWFQDYLFDVGYPDDWLRDSPNLVSGRDRFIKAMEYESK